MEIDSNLCHILMCLKIDVKCVPEVDYQMSNSNEQEVMSNFGEISPFHWEKSHKFISIITVHPV